MLKEFGQDLKSLRESKNITIAEISAQTRINSKFIINMEAGHFDFQPDTYVRAFLKEYAKSINENEDQIVNDYLKAKAGFYSRKKMSREQPALPVKPIEHSDEHAGKSVESEKVSESIVVGASEEKDYETDSKDEFSNKTPAQRILLVLVILVGLFGMFYLYKTLSNKDRQTTEIKPKSFSEISEDYENKIRSKIGDTSITKKDSLSGSVADSLKLTVKAFKEVRIKVYVDEKRIVEEVIQPKDSLIITASQQFRFSSSANSSIELFLNDKFLRKPSSLNGNTIKNLVINKDGIASQ